MLPPHVEDDGDDDGDSHDGQQRVHEHAEQLLVLVVRDRDVQHCNNDRNKKSKHARTPLNPSNATHTYMPYIYV